MTSSLPAAQPYWVFFHDQAENTPIELSPKADQRLAKQGLKSHRGSYPVSSNSLEQLRAAGFKIRHSSRFLNAVSLEIEDDQDLKFLNQMEIVKSTQKVAQRVVDKTAESHELHRSTSFVDSSYGLTLTQNDLLHIPLFHGFGYDGSGVTIGVFDTGFLTSHAVFNELDIVAQYDFVDHESDPSGPGDDHGVNVLSAVGGFFLDKFIGPAYGASYLLARTEDVNSETRAEEDNWVAALEWADSLGVDIISSSLSYRLQHDDPSEDYPDSAIDGQTAVITRAANIAAERGILVVNSVSNEGPEPMTVWPPADSPHVLAVGATNSSGSIAGFSGRGPTYDGRIKPDVVTMGISVFMASGTRQFIVGHGTSFSTPQISGLAAFLLQANPGLSPDEIISIFHRNGSHANMPDNAYGYGIPDFRWVLPNMAEGISQNCLIYPNPSSKRSVVIELKDPVGYRVSNASIYNLRGQKIGDTSHRLLSESRIELNLPAGKNYADQLFIVSVRADNQTFSGKFIYTKP